MINKLQLFIFLLLTILVFRFFFFYNNQFQYKDGEAVSFEATLFSEPQFTTLQKLTVNLPEGGVVYITAPRFPEYQYGDRLAISSTLSKKLIKGRIIYSMSFPKISLVKTENSPFLAVTAFIRQSVTELFNKTLPPDLSSLLLGIVFGIKGPMSNDFNNNLRLAGVMHVIAASGMNVTMVAWFLSAIFTFFLKRQTALFLSILGIVFYAFLAGMQASIIRASIMGILVFSSQILGRQNLGTYGLFLAGFVMLFISPSLISDVGFQLSFAATAGLLYLNPLLISGEKSQKLLKKLPVAEDFFITLSAQTATLPILLVTFGTYSVWSVIVNALVLWTIPPLMVLGGIGAVLGMIFQPLGAILIYLSLPFLLYFQKIVTFFGSMPGVLQIQNLPFSLIFGYYLVLFSIVSYFLKLKAKNA